MSRGCGRAALLPPLVLTLLLAGSRDRAAAAAAAALDPLRGAGAAEGAAAGPTAGPSPRDPEPDFTGPISNVTVPLGREAVLTCSVTDLGDYKVAWIRADDQTILSLHTRLVTHSARYAVTSDAPGAWHLHIRPLRVEDRGCYMCQINTHTMRKSVGCVDVLVPPDILDEGTSGDLVTREGEHASLTCRAEGRPTPRILWRREDARNILLRNELGELRKVDMYMGPELNLSRVERRQMGAYLCIASNDVPPSVSKRIMLSVYFTPSVAVSRKVRGVVSGAGVRLECLVEAYPAPINYWLKGNDEIILAGERHEISERHESVYQVVSALAISGFTSSDAGAYTCVSTNTMGKAEGTMRLYEIKMTTSTSTTTTTPPPPTTPSTTPATPATSTTSDQFTLSPSLPPPPRSVVPAEHKYYTADVTTFDTMQNVIEQSVLDNQWLPTAESTGSRAPRPPHPAPPLAPLLLILTYLHYLYSHRITTHHLTLR